MAATGTGTLRIAGILRGVRSRAMVYPETQTREPVEGYSGYQGDVIRTKRPRMEIEAFDLGDEGGAYQKSLQQLGRTQKDTAVLTMDSGAQFVLRDCKLLGESSFDAVEGSLEFTLYGVNMEIV